MGLFAQLVKWFKSGTSNTNPSATNASAEKDLMEWMAGSLKRMKEYSNRTNDKFKDALVKSRSTKGVEVVGSNKEERINHMTQIFKGMDK